MDNKYIKTNVNGLVIDRSSTAVLNVDNQQLAAYKKQKAAMNRTVDTAKRLHKVERDVSEIKDMLALILEKLTT